MNIRHRALGMKYEKTLFMNGEEQLGIILEYKSEENIYRCYNVTNDIWFTMSEIALKHAFYSSWWIAL